MITPKHIWIFDGIFREKLENEKPRGTELKKDGKQEARTEDMRAADQRVRMKRTAWPLCVNW